MSDIKNDPSAKIVYTALLRMSDDRAVIKQAFQRWVAELSAQPFDVIETVDNLEKFLGMSTQERKVLMIGMHAAANRAPHELNEVPDYLLDDGAVASSEKVAAPTVRARQPVTELTEAYFRHVFNETKTLNISGYRELVSIIEDEGLDDVDDQINSKVKRSQLGKLELPSGMSEDDCKTVCHSLYMLLAEVVGPMDADVISNKAISALMQMEVAARFDPRELL